MLTISEKSFKYGNEDIADEFGMRSSPDTPQVGMDDRSILDESVQ